MFHSFTGNAKMFSFFVFDDCGSRALAGVLTEGDCLAVWTCLQGMHAEVDLTRLFVREMRHKPRLSDMLRAGQVCYANMAG
jgi:hypothetical protein